MKQTLYRILSTRWVDEMDIPSPEYESIGCDWYYLLLNTVEQAFSNSVTSSFGVSRLSITSEHTGLDRAVGYVLSDARDEIFINVDMVDGDKYSVCDVSISDITDRVICPRINHTQMISDGIDNWFSMHKVVKTKTIKVNPRLSNQR